MISAVALASLLGGVQKLIMLSTSSMNDLKVWLCSWLGDHDREWSLEHPNLVLIESSQMHFFVSKKEMHLGSEGSVGQRLLGSINISVLSRSLVLLITSGLSFF